VLSLKIIVLVAVGILAQHTVPAEVTGVTIQTLTDSGPSRI
jgi:hypothetical protein